MKHLHVLPHIPKGTFLCHNYICCYPMMKGSMFKHRSTDRTIQARGRITWNHRCVVYILKCPCNLYYVGKTKQDPSQGHHSFKTLIWKICFSVFLLAWFLDGVYLTINCKRSLSLHQETALSSKQQQQHLLARFEWAVLCGFIAPLNCLGHLHVLLDLLCVIIRTCWPSHASFKMSRGPLTCLQCKS